MINQVSGDSYTNWYQIWKTSTINNLVTTVQNEPNRKRQPVRIILNQYLPFLVGRYEVMVSGVN